MQMVNSKRQKRINEAMRLVHPSYRPVKNAVRLSLANTIEHEQAKFWKCWELLQDGTEFYTEVIFIGGGRADIYIPERMQVMEILHSESEAEALDKIEKYPPALDIILVRAERVNRYYEK